MILHLILLILTVLNWLTFLQEKLKIVRNYKICFYSICLGFPFANFLQKKAQIFAFVALHICAKK